MKCLCLVTHISANTVPWLYGRRRNQPIGQSAVRLSNKQWVLKLVYTLQTFSHKSGFAPAQTQLAECYASWREDGESVLIADLLSKCTFGLCLCFQSCVWETQCSRVQTSLPLEFTSFVFTLPVCFLLCFQEP